MSEEVQAEVTTESPAGSLSTEAPEEVTTQASQEDTLGEKGLAALKSEREARKAAEKQLAAFQARIDEVEAAERTELENANHQLEKAKAEAATAKAELDKLRVMQDTGLPADMAEFLTGDSVEALTEQAEKLKAATANASTTEKRSPAADPSQGAKPNDAAQLTEADLQGMSPQQVDQARKDGRLNVLMGIKN